MWPQQEAKELSPSQVQRELDPREAGSLERGGALASPRGAPPQFWGTTPRPRISTPAHGEQGPHLPGQDLLARREMSRGGGRDSRSRGACA